jgi:acyl carrier protein
MFAASFNIAENKINENLKYNEIEEWDSIGHMSLMSTIEDGFKISLETDDIIDFSSFKKGMEILEKYKIKFDE